MRHLIIFQAVLIGLGALTLYRGRRLRRKGSPRFAAERGKGLMIQGVGLLALGALPGTITLAALIILHPVGMMIERIYRPRMTMGKVLRAIFNGERLEMIPPTREQVQRRKAQAAAEALKALENGAMVAALIGLVAGAVILARPDLSLPPWPQVIGICVLGVLGAGYIIFWMDLT